MSKIDVKSKRNKKDFMQSDFLLWWNAFSAPMLLNYEEGNQIQVSLQIVYQHIFNASHINFLRSTIYRP